MLIFDRENWPKHRPWAICILLASAAAAAWYIGYGLRRGGGVWQWPSGASPPGFTYGVVGGAIIVFEMFLWPRKYLWRGRRLGRTKYWMMGHIWLGALVLPLILLHGSFHFALGRSPLAAVLMWLLLFVFLSGLLGATLQHIIPRVMLDRIPAETIYGQIDHVLDLYHREAEQLVEATCGIHDEASGAAEHQGARATDPMDFVVGGTVRSAGAVQGKVVVTGVAVPWVPGSEPLLTFFRKSVEPYLLAKSGKSHILDRPVKAEALFRDLKVRLRPDTYGVVDRLEELCNQRRQFDLQARLHGWLHLWMAVHLVLSAALLVLMAAHGYLALKYL
jgi:hypothetical protein